MAWPWSKMSSGVVMMNGSGSSELMPLFAEEIRIKLKWEETNIVNLLWLKDVGEATAGFAEMIMKKFNPLFVFLLGVLIRTLCLVLLYISVIGLGGIGSPLWSIYMLSFLCVVAETTAKTAIENILVLEFFSTKELVLLILRASSNLSGSVVTSVYQAANPTVDSGSSSIILIQTIISLLTSLPGSVLLIARHFHNAVELKPKNPTPTLIKYALMSTALVTVIFVGSHIREHSVQIATAVLACVFGIAPLYIGYRIEQHEQLKSAEAEQEEQVIHPVHNYNFWRPFFSIEFGLILLGSCIALSSTTSAMDFVAQVLESFSIKTNKLGIVLSQMCVSSFFGRVSLLFFSEYLVHGYNVVRSYLFFPLLLLSFFSLIFIAYPFSLNFSIVSIAFMIISYTNGALWQLVALILRDFFKDKSFLLFYILKFFIPICTYFIKIKFISHFYQTSVQENNPSFTKNVISDLSCIGYNCFRKSFLILSLSSLLSILSWAFYCKRERRLDRTYSKFVRL